MSSITIGTSGFSFDDWRGTVYPHHLKKEEWLPYYEQELGFKALEVNFTYYTLPSPRTLEGMSRKTSQDFAFVVKAYRGMTHDILTRGSTSIGDNTKTFEQFATSLKPLIDARKLACVLAQFPYAFHPSEKSYDYLKRSKELLAPLPLTIEFRNRKWLTAKTVRFLKEYDLGYCAVDEPRLPQLMPFYPLATSKIGYFRFHGRNTRWFNVPSSVRYDYLYSTPQMREFIAPLTSIASKTDRVFVFFNNCHAGSAVQNAAMLIRMIREHEKS